MRLRGVKSPAALRKGLLRRQGSYVWMVLVECSFGFPFEMLLKRYPLIKTYQITMRCQMALSTQLAAEGDMGNT
jgi:hypothetical protein